MKVTITIDLGGTNTRMALMENQQVITEHHFLTKSIKTTADLLASINQLIPDDLDSLTIAIGGAGPVIDEQLQLTNYPLKISRREIIEYFTSKYKVQLEVYLLNDLEALGYSLFSLKDQDYQQIAGPIRKPELKGQLALIAPGTGLGEAYLLKGEVYPTEGGHTPFAPTNKEELELLTYYALKRTNLSYESLLSGTGLVKIYKVLYEQENNKPFKGQLTPESITKLIISDLKNKNTLEYKTIKIFLHILGQEARNMVLRLKATDGLFLGGNIANYLLPLLEKTSYFHTAFLSQKQQQKLLDNVPIYLITLPDAQLYGLAYYVNKKSSH